MGSGEGLGCPAPRRTLLYWPRAPGSQLTRLTIPAIHHSGEWAFGEPGTCKSWKLRSIRGEPAAPRQGLGPQGRLGYFMDASSCLWSNWEVETCQLSARLHLDVSKPLGGRACPQQDLQLPPQPTQALLSCPRGPLRSVASPWCPLCLTQRLFPLHLCSVLHTRPLETQARGSEKGETTASHLAGPWAARHPAPAPLPLCSHITRPSC